MLPRLGLTRTIVRNEYALISRDGHVPSVLPGWTNCTAYVLISAAMGAGIGQFLIDLAEGGRGSGQTEGDAWFFYVVSGSATINGRELAAGGFAYVPAEAQFDCAGAGPGAQVLIFRQPYEPLAGAAAPPFLSGQESDIAEAPFLGDPRARLKTLLPDSPGADMAVNIFTYDPGATLPFVETHVMEHGMLFLAGSGVYRLGEDWHPVQAGDAIWIAPFCPQWFIAAGPEPARYIYCKDVNRLPP